MKDLRLKIVKISLMAVTLALCVFLAVQLSLAWFTSNTSKMTVVTGDADLGVTFYRLRDFNCDGAYDYNDYVNDRAAHWEHFDAFEAALLATFDVAPAAITAENFGAAFGKLSDDAVMTYTYTTDFAPAVKNVRMGSYVRYRVRIANNSERAAECALSFSDLMRYYYNKAQMQYFLQNHAGDTPIDVAIGDDPAAGVKGDNIKNYAAKFLFSVYYGGESGGVASMPLWQAAQSEIVTALRVAAQATADLDFALSFDGKSVAADYLAYATGAGGECYNECLGIAETLTLPATFTDTADFTAKYLRAVYEAEMTYLFSSSSGEGGVATDVDLKLDYIMITGTLIGEAAA